MNNLLKALAGSDFDTTLVGPKGDTFHHIQTVDVIQGNDDYESTAILHVTHDEFSLSKEKIKLPHRAREMGGVVITIWSEEGYLWSKQLLFHKGMIFESDNIIEENVNLYEPEPVEDDSQLSFNL